MESKKITSLFNNKKGIEGCFSFPSGLKHRIEKFCSTNSLKPFVPLLAAYTIILSRYFFQEKIIVNITHELLLGKNKEIKYQSNDSSNCYPLVVELQETMTYESLLHRIMENFIDPDTESAPFQEIDNSNPTEKLNNSNAFFMYSENFQDQLVLQKIAERINLIAGEKDNQLQFIVNNDKKSHFIPEISTLISHFLSALNSIIINPKGMIGETEVVSREEVQKLIFDFGSNLTPTKNDETLDSLFETTVGRFPDKTAVVVDGVSMSFCELNSKADKLACYLRKQGVGPGVIVGLLLSVSSEMVIGILAVLKAGGSYLPLDPDHPASRTQFILEDCKASFLLVKKCPEWIKNTVYSQSNVINISLCNKIIYAEDFSSFKKLHTPEDPCYLIYTSGTTGKPKGVWVRHHSISQTITWRIAEYRFDDTDSVLQLFSYAFDGFITAFFTPLLSGVKVVFPDKNEIMNIAELKKYIIRWQISHFICVPSLFQVLLDVPDNKTITQLKVITLAGDKIEYKLIDTCRKKCPGLEIVNEYGPTENSVVSTIKRHVERDACLTIGKPIPNTQILILNRTGKLQPVGAPGEICLAGGRLAEGYLNRPELSNRKFIKTPYLNDKIMYRTGDIGRWQEDGNIEFLGRIDFQVKIRGFRIELQDIEAVLLQNRNIKSAAVVTNRNSSRNISLFAFYTTIDSTEDIPLLKDFVSKRLPDYMVPSFFIRLPRLPLTFNGKVDFSALEEEVQAFISQKKEKVSEKTVESLDIVNERLKKIWTDILEIGGIDPAINFLEQGGNSISLMQMHVAVEKEFNITLSTENTDQFSTINGLAALIKNSDKTKAFNSL